MQHFPIYLDYSATTPVDPRVAAKMIPYLTENFGNPASRSHSFGWDAEAAVENARKQVATLVNCDPKVRIPDQREHPFQHRERSFQIEREHLFQN
jgi:cysteine desulfurase